MFYYKIIIDGESLGYAMSGVAVDFPTYVPVDEAEYNEYMEAETARQQQQDMVEEQADLLNRRAEGNLSKAEAAYIEARLEEISDYWDSLEPMEVTYGTN